jgi:hypothetical protein
VIVTASGHEILVDPKDEAMLLAFVWRVFQCGGNQTPRAYTWQQGRRLWMHHVIQPTPPGYEVDHANGNGLDNRRANLRPATRKQNAANRKRRRDNRSGFTGVRRHRRYGVRPWHAVITSGGVRHHLGTFATAEEAAHVYNEAAKALHGPFAALNPIPAKETA